MKKEFSIGEKVNNYTVLERVYVRNPLRNYYLCKCDCGNLSKIKPSNMGVHNCCRSCAGEFKKKFNIGDLIKDCEIIDYIKSEHKYVLKCICGQDFKKGTNDLDGPCICCKSCYKQKYYEYSRKADENILKNQQYSRYQDNARKRNHEWNISNEDFCLLISKKCYYCDSYPDREVKGKSKNNPLVILVHGLDRVDNSKGYSLENCVTCCELCNRAKRALDLEEFETWIKKISDNLQNKGSFKERIK